MVPPRSFTRGLVEEINMEALGYVTTFVVTAIVAMAALLVREIPGITRYLRIRQM
jgi:hypothetical protein